MRKARDHYPDCPQPMLVVLAQSGDRDAFAELVTRKQSSIRTQLRQCCGQVTLADDLAQQAFLQAWLKIRSLRKVESFDAWLKRLATTTWLQYVRKKDVVWDAQELPESTQAPADAAGVGMDLERALATLAVPMRACVVLAYQHGLSHSEISKATSLPLGTVKSHILRGSKRLRELLSAYAINSAPKEN